MQRYLLQHCVKFWEIRNHENIQQKIDSLIKLGYNHIRKYFAVIERCMELFVNVLRYLWYVAKQTKKTGYKEYVKYGDILI